MVEYTHHIPPECHEAVEVLFFDDDILVVSKPSGLLSVPGRIVKDSVINRMMVDFPDLRAVHRLDLDTSGLLVFGISQLAVSELNRQFRERTVLKEYVAEVDGVIADDIGELSYRQDSGVLAAQPILDRLSNTIGIQECLQVGFE